MPVIKPCDCPRRIAPCSKVRWRRFPLVPRVFITSFTSYLCTYTIFGGNGKGRAVFAKHYDVFQTNPTSLGLFHLFGACSCQIVMIGRYYCACHRLLSKSAGIPRSPNASRLFQHQNLSLFVCQFVPHRRPLILHKRMDKLLLPCNTQRA